MTTWRPRKSLQQGVTVCVALSCLLLTGTQSGTAQGKQVTPAPAPIAVQAVDPGIIRVLTDVDQVHQLSKAEATTQVPIQVTGVVTAFPGLRNYFFLEDATGSTAVNRTDNTSVALGDVVEVTGHSDPGFFVASVMADHVKVVGHAELPDAKLFTYPELEGGAQDSRYIAVEGIVHTARVVRLWDHDVLSLSIVGDASPITVLLRNFAPGDAERLVDALVLVRGVCGTTYNDKRQFTGIRMFVAGLNDVILLEPAPTEAFALPAKPLHTLLQFDHFQRSRHRVKVTGIAIAQSPGHFLYLQNNQDGIRIASTLETLVPTGANVEAVGFAASGKGFSPILKDAVFRIVGQGVPASPTTITESDFLQHTETARFAPLDSQLVRIQAHVLESAVGVHDQTWLLRCGSTVFTASLERPKNSPSPRNADVGSIVDVVGVFTVDEDAELDTQSFHVLLRTPEDLILDRKPSWWTPVHAIGVIAVLLALVALVALWGVLLRQRVKAQTVALRTSEERFRHQAQTDALTGLASRSFLYEELEDLMLQAEDGTASLGVLMIDLDNFKQVNDTLGHHVGDELLQVVGERLRDSVRTSDVIARMGGDEFVVLLKELKDDADLEMIGAKVVANVSLPARVGGRLLHISASVGACMYTPECTDASTLLQQVDAAMYNAKAAGRDSLSVYRGAVARK